MAAKAISRTVRRRVRDRAFNRCEYCQHPADFACAPFVCEHVMPRVEGAGSSLSELAWACPGCNSHKYAKTHARDPRTGRTVSLLNPRRQQWSRHFAWSADFLLVHGRTAAARATIEALHLNRPQLINLRRALRAIGAHPHRTE